jgi:hypothetical protein
MHRLPFDAGREAGAAAAAQSRLGHFLDDAGGTQCQRLLKALVTTEGAIGVDGQRVDETAAREGEARLPGEIVDLVDRP